VRCPLLDALPPGDRTYVLANARRRHFDRGEVVFREGDPGDSFHLVETGVFAVHVAGPDGDAAILNVLAAGDFFGELALIRSAGDRRRTATVRPLVPSSTLVIAGSAFVAMRAAHPAVDQLVTAALVQRVEQLGTRLLEALYLSVDRRVYRRLLELAEVFSTTSAHLRIPVTQDELASMAGASRPTVNQVLQRLAARGIVSLHRREIVIDDLTALRAAAPDFDLG
jgi:CRP/FNR family transcriptional regulator, cyclic AMP receptor protein